VGIKEFTGSIEYGIVPIGTVVAWAKSFTGTPALADGWAECNGQVYSDANSVYNGKTLPYLNGTTNATKRHLRGARVSGGTGGSSEGIHFHSLSASYSWAQPSSGSGVYAVTSIGSGYANSIAPYYEVVFVMRTR